MNDIFINVGIYLSYGLLAIAALTAIIFPIIHFIKDFRKAKGTLLGLAVLLVVLVASWAVAGGGQMVIDQGSQGSIIVSSTVSKLVGGGIIATMALIILGLVAAVYTEVSKLFK
ncbi:MAG: hypothetical protein KGZ97_00365 [Bacteroidetes bacterium]|nr:hypothetical protein [Bacteroidota bacterium]